MKILILNGPNLNLLGTRRPDIYGAMTLDDIVEGVRCAYPAVTIDHRQSNHEGELIDLIHAARGCYDGIVFNAGAYTHTSLALADAIEAVEIPVVEIHLSNVAAREQIRQRSMIAPVCAGVISGFGPLSYRLGVEAIINMTDL